MAGGNRPYRNFLVLEIETTSLRKNQTDGEQHHRPLYHGHFALLATNDGIEFRNVQLRGSALGGDE